MTSARISRVWGIILLTITIFSLSLPAYAQYSGGTGEPNDPYQIATAADLIALGEIPDDYDKHFILTADIDLDPNLPGGKVFDRAVIAADTNDVREWFEGAGFAGVFDGNGHTISHLTIKGASHVGLFDCLVFGAQVRDLRMLDANITSSDIYTGTFVARNFGTVIGCDSTGVVRGRWCVGGLIGWNNGHVTRCISRSVVIGAASVGGLVGENYQRGTVTQCYADCVVSGDTNVGGLMGFNAAPGRVSLCYSMGSVHGTDRVGGLVGSNVSIGRSGVELIAQILQCYSATSVNADSNFGGLSGYNRFGVVTQCFWDTETSGQTISDGGEGKTTAEMQTASTFLEAGWDFVGETVNGTEDIWKMAEGLGYPRLAWQKYSGGTGEPNDPYQIATAADLITLGETPEDYDKHFILTADIDLDPNQPGRKVFNRAVIAPDTNDTDPGFQGTPFTGVFDGDHHSISYLTMRGGRNLALFGLLESGGEVRDLGIVLTNITGSEESYYIGALVGFNGNERQGYFTAGGLVTRCYSTGAVNGAGNVGGLVGFNAGTVTQSCSSAHATVSGTHSVGSLVGINFGIVAACYSTGAVSGAENSPRAPAGVGGLVGQNGGLVTNCYSISAVGGSGWWIGGLAGINSDQGTIIHCLWDVETSGQTTSDGGEGKTTAEMQTASTFLDACWDFLGETVNGTEDIWWILEGQDYPRLWWEAAEQ